MTCHETGFSAECPLTAAGGFCVGAASASSARHDRSARRLRDQLFAEGYRFEFAQAVRLLEQLAPGQRPVGRQGTAEGEALRFRVPASLAFPASEIQQLRPPTDHRPCAEMWVNFLGLTGPSGILPRHFTEMLVRRHIDFRGAERYVLQDWLDLFNHRFIAMFYRAWEKHRFWIAFERGEHLGETPDGFTACLRGLIGLAPPSLHNRLQVSIPRAGNGESARDAQVHARIQDTSLLRYAGLLSQRRRSAGNLEALLADYFLVPVTIEQFQGQWLRLAEDDQSRLGGDEPTAVLGTSATVGPRVWNVQGKFRVRLGPLRYEQFCEFFPDPVPEKRRKAFFLLSQLVRLFVGPEFDFDVQLTLRRDEVPSTRLTADSGIGARLGWNTWLCNSPLEQDAEDAVLASRESP